MSRSQLCIDMMTPMKEEFVYEIDDNEKRLNQEIDDLLDGIERDAPNTFPEHNQHEQSKRNEYIKSPIPCTQEENKNRSLDDPKDMFQQHVSNVYYSVDKSESSDDSVTMTDVYQQSVNNHQMELISEQNEMSSPIIQPFICSEEKSSEQFFMDTLEERNEVKMDTSEVMEVKMEEKMETTESIQVSFLNIIIYLFFNVFLFV